MWDEIYERHYPELLKYCMGACRDKELAEDLVQETFLKALQNADTFEELGSNQRRAWLYRTMKNLLYDRYRRAVLEAGYLQQLEEDAAYLDPGIQQTETELILQKLTPEDQMLFTLRYMEGYNASEISEMLGMPTGTIRAKLSRSRKILKNMIEE
ncbi:MAG: RNA polymerase sigma factor [Oscillospiraceae bacterium]|nr:RNA polymerase sigma factor [Oscillospiraceae bacterium]